jgi:hypothetical protein
LRQKDLTVSRIARPVIGRITNKESRPPHAAALPHPIYEINFRGHAFLIINGGGVSR